MLQPMSLSGQSVEIIAVGDILLTRGVEKRIEKFGLAYPFERVSPLLKKADLVFGNLENPITDKCDESAKNISFQAKPEYSKILPASGLDILSLANNHTLDCGEIGLAETKRNLKNQKIRFVGGGENQNLLIIEIKKIKIAFIGFTAVSPIFPEANSPLISSAAPENIKKITESARQQSDIVIASFHWGTEYVSRPNKEQINLAKIAVEAGADVVLGHHPHVLQGFQVVNSPNRKSLIAYSLGNFVFDSPTKLIKDTAESVILKIRVSQKGLESAEIVPVTIKDYRPVFADQKKRQIINTKLQKLSADLGTTFENGKIFGKTNFTKSIETDLDFNGKKERIDLNSGRDSTLQIWQGKKLIWQGVPARWQPWKLEIADVDGDGKREIIVGVFKSTKFFPKPHNCLFIYGWEGNRAYKKWLGSSLARPFTDFLFADLDEVKGDELIALETNLDGKKSLGIYKWNGFGFTLEHKFGNWQTAEILGVEKRKIWVKADGERLEIGEMQKPARQ